MKCELKNICQYRIGKVLVNTLDNKNYVSTENMLPDKRGIQPATSLPNTAVTQRYCVGDVLVSNIRPYFKKIYFAKNDGGCSNDVLVFQPLNDVEPQYLYYVLANDEFFAYCTASSKGTKMPRGDKGAIMQYKVNLPDLETQKKIAKVLSALDDKIELNNQINKNLEEQANALFERQFINNDNLPVNWTQGSLLDIADYLNGLAMQSFRPSDNEIGLPVLKIKELRQGLCDDNSELCSPSIKSEYIVHDGDVIFSWSGSLLVDLWCGGTCGLNQHLFKVTSNKYDKWYYYLWTKHHLKHFIGVASDKATTMGHIKRGDLLNAKVLIPSERDYKSMSSIFKPIIEKIVTNRIENRKLALIRDAILPKLMSGEIDVDNVKI